MGAGAWLRRYVGLKNLGNSCYMNSVLQALWALPQVAQRYAQRAPAIYASAPADPASDFPTQVTHPSFHPEPRLLEFYYFFQCSCSSCACSSVLPPFSMWGAWAYGNLAGTMHHKQHLTRSSGDYCGSILVLSTLQQTQ